MQTLNDWAVACERNVDEWLILQVVEFERSVLERDSMLTIFAEDRRNEDYNERKLYKAPRSACSYMDFVDVNMSRQMLMLSKKKCER